MKLLQQLLEMSYQDLNYVEDIVDALWNKLGIDVRFSKHFFDRLNDARNEKDISTAELIQLFKKQYEKHGTEIRKFNDKEEGVMKDLLSKINLPFAINHKSGKKELVAQTILRKPGFHSKGKEFPV